MPLDVVAQQYVQGLKAAGGMGVSAEPEAQLTVPVHDLFINIAKGEGLGEFVLIREAQLDGVRPDFAAMLDGRPVGWVELKAPGHSLDGAAWKGRERRQWSLLAELDALIVTDGSEAWLYSAGAVVDTAALPGHEADWDSAPLAALLRQFTSSRPATVTRVSQLAERLAPLTRLLRDRIATGLAGTSPVAPIMAAKSAWITNVHEGATDDEFASDLAQVIAYALAIAALRGGADKDHDSYLSLTEARDALRGPNDMLAAALGPALDIPGLTTALRFEIGAIERLASAVNAVKVAASKDSRGEPWLWFYEDFLASYDPDARKQAGVYYTPANVVDLQVRLTDHVLREVMSIPLGFGDQGVVTLDPAAGSGTYPLGVLDRAAETALEERGSAGPKQVAKSLVKNLIAFELMPGPYAVSHLRIGQRLAEMEGALTPPENVRVYLTNTLDDPEQHQPTLGLFGDMATLAEERAKAAQVKRTQKVTVVLGNPPYARRTAASGGGWVVHPAAGRALFDDVIEPARAAGVIFSAMRSLYDDYVYFWRWSLWKAFEQDQQGGAVVSFITSSTWLRGPAFLGLRRLARALADEMWIVDLGGAGRGAVKDENVFAIQTPVAIVTLFRRSATSGSTATVRYRQVVGTGSEKLTQLTQIAPPALQPDEWTELDFPADAPLIPGTGGEEWDTLPELTNLFPWQQPGVNFGRSWAVSPSRDVLERRWRALLERQDADARATAFVTAKTGRNIFTTVGGLPRLADLASDAPHRELVPLAYRSFDVQWTFDDPRVALLERPSLWRSLSGNQLFITTMATNPIGPGPALVATTAVPDFHYFAGRGGKDVFPLYRDGHSELPNITAGLLDVLEQRLGLKVTPQGLASYVFALLAHPGYQQRFAVELQSPGLHVPITTDPDLFTQVAETGARVLWLQTRAQRLQDSQRDRGTKVPPVDGLEWTEAVTRIPTDMTDVAFDSSTRTLRIADGVVSGVLPEVWDFNVSGLAVLQRWLGSRTAKGVGRATQARWMTPLDAIRPLQWEDSWNDDLLALLRSLTHLVQLYPVQAGLLADVMNSELLQAVDLPTPSAAEQAPPAT